MIILIGGCSSVGKSLMAQRLLERCLIPYLSIDHLKMGLYRANPHCGFTPLDSTETIEGHLWPVLKGIIETNIENGQHLIIEGCYLLPQRLSAFAAAYQAEIIPVFIVLSEAYIRRQYHSAIIQYRNVIERRQGPEERTPEEMIAENAALKARCLASGVACFEIDGDYASALEDIFRRVEREFTARRP